MVRTRARPDHETRRRLLTAGARLFASRGHAHVTVREICGAAGANIAAINYHFGSKAGLYAAVVDVAADSIRDVTREAVRAGYQMPAEQRLRAYVRVVLARAVEDEDGWIHQMLLREISEPTEALDRIINEGLQPQLVYVQGIVAELLGSAVSDPRVARCAFSVHAQCHAMMSIPLAERTVPGYAGADGVADMADHITEFSLAGLWALARQI